MATHLIARAIAVSLTTFVMILTGGCASDKDSGPRPPAGWPEKFEGYSMIWSAEPGIDLTTGPAVVVRAYTESYHLADLMGDDKYLYPGFERSVEHGPDLWPKPDRPTKTPWVGTERDHILTVSRSDREVTAVVCAYMYGTAQEEHDGEYSAQAGNPFEPNAGVYPVRVTLTVPVDGERQMSPQMGAARTPHDDVFDGWSITSHLGGYFIPSGSTWSEYGQDLETCAAKDPDPERRQFLISGLHPRSEFPTLPAYPGWPENDH